jgi:hypothetical protein
MERGMTARLPKLAPTPIKLFDASAASVPRGPPGGLTLALAAPPPTAAPVDPAVRDLADKVRALIARGDVDPFSAIDIIRAAGKVGAGWDRVESVVVQLAKGADGIGGTPDDVIPPSTLSVMLTLLHTGVVTDLVGWVRDLCGGGESGAGAGAGRGSRWACWRA